MKKTGINKRKLEALAALAGLAILLLCQPEQAKATALDEESQEVTVIGEKKEKEKEPEILEIQENELQEQEQPEPAMGDEQSNDNESVFGTDEIASIGICILFVVSIILGMVIGRTFFRKL